MIPEPLIVITDAEGNPKLLPGWELPARTIVDVHNVYFRGWTVIEAPLVKFLFEGDVIVYERIGYGLHGEWICDLRSGGANASP